MTKYYSISGDRIVIRPLAFLVPIAWVLIALLVLAPLAVILILTKGDLNETQPKTWASLILVLPLLLACIPLFAYGRRQLIFDNGQQVIFIRALFGIRPLMNYSQVAEISWKQLFGIGYYIKSRDDRFGKGYRISPAFAGVKDKDKLEYEQTVLPAIRQALASQSTPIDPGTNLPVPGKLVFFIPHSVGYVLKSRGRLVYVLLIVFFGLAAWAARDRQLMLFALIPVTIGVVMFNKRIVFNMLQQQVNLSVLGIPLASYPFTHFAGFSIVRKTMNGMYNGTDVRMKFIKQGTKRIRELLLADFRKTNPIEPFIKEVEYILTLLPEKQQRLN